MGGPTAVQTGVFNCGKGSSGRYDGARAQELPTNWASTSSSVVEDSAVIPAIIAMEISNSQPDPDPVTVDQSPFDGGGDFGGAGSDGSW